MRRFHWKKRPPNHFFKRANWILFARRRSSTTFRRARGRPGLSIERAVKFDLTITLRSAKTARHRASDIGAPSRK
jgi:hypothetical protein